jgi:hypothetical protein
MQLLKSLSLSLDPVYEEVKMSHDGISVGVNEAYGHVTRMSANI